MPNSIKEKRLMFHSILISALGSENVYYQPPSNFQMMYPCIKYEMTDLVDKKADNIKYKRYTRFTVTIISKDPDPEAVEILTNLKFSEFDRSFSASGLNHYVITIYI